jgi:hypothetical protein
MRSGSSENLKVNPELIRIRFRPLQDKTTQLRNTRVVVQSALCEAQYKYVKPLSWSTSPTFPPGINVVWHSAGLLCPFLAYLVYVDQHFVLVSIPNSFFERLDLFEACFLAKLQYC